MSFTAQPAPQPAPPRVAKPWGEELILSRSNDAVCKVLRIRAGHRLSLQLHRRKRETMIVLRGEVRLTLGPSIQALSHRTLRPGQRAQVAPGTIHRLEALSADAEVLEFASADDGDDLVRLEDDYGRAEPRVALP